MSMDEYKYSDKDKLNYSEMALAIVSIIVLLTLIFIPSFSYSDSYEWKFLEIIDGDTIRMDPGSDFPKELSPVVIRLQNVDTPEKGRRAKCDEEKVAGEKATEFTKNILENARSIIVTNLKYGKFGGRLIGEVLVDNESLSDLIIKMNHGRKYKNKRFSWCD